MKHTRVLLLPATLVAALLLTACGGAGDGGRDGDGQANGDAEATAPATSGEPNAADVSFAQGMIPHHRQAVEMSRLAADRADGADVRELAEEIERAQAPEIEQLSGWLTEWGEDVPADGADGHGTDDGHGMDDADGHGMADGHAGSMPGMLDDAAMAELAEASGAEFDRRFLELMIEHHEGAVAMSRSQLKEGAHDPARELAEEIIATQQAEIDRMERLLGTD